MHRLILCFDSAEDANSTGSSSRGYRFPIAIRSIAVCEFPNNRSNLLELDYEKKTPFNLDSTEPGSEMYIPYVGRCTRFLMFHDLLLARVLFPQWPQWRDVPLRIATVMTDVLMTCRMRSRRLIGQHIFDLLQAIFNDVLKLNEKKCQEFVLIEIFTILELKITEVFQR